MNSTYTTYTTLTRNLDRTLQLKAAESVNARETAYYQENIRKVETIDEFLGDYRLYTYAMKAFGLDDMIYAKAYMRKVLTEGVADKDSFANKLLDERFKEFATVFDFEAYGKVTTLRQEVTTGVVEKYNRAMLEADAGEENEGVRLALYFQRKAPEIDSYYDILADKALTKFFQVTFSLPESMSSIDVDQQVRLLEKVFDLSALKDPEELEHLTKRFTIMYDIEENPVSDPVLSLFGGSDTQATLDEGLIMTLKNLKLGG